MTSVADKPILKQKNHKFTIKAKMRALICGVGVQDGAYLSRLLLDAEYEVIGSLRDSMTTSFSNLTNLVILNKMIAASMALSDFHSILQTLVKAEYPWNLKTRRNFD